MFISLVSLIQKHLRRSVGFGEERKPYGRLARAISRLLDSALRILGEVKNVHHSYESNLKKKKSPNQM